MSGQPFDVTKAVDFSDDQIASTYVDLPGANGFAQLLHLESPMPLFLLGGKGSGRTHLMRYRSYVVQRIRAGSEPFASFLAREGYIGVYMRCEGLNAGRFDGKGVPSDAWNAVFQYYMDLWLAHLCVETLCAAFDVDQLPQETRQAIFAESSALFEDDLLQPCASSGEFLRQLTSFRREVDRAVNNAALRRSLGDLAIRATRGRLVFGLPRIFADHIEPLQRIQIVYLIDELENLTVSQQAYVNTLVRERQPPCTFKVGARLYGFKTKRTLSADEENRVGSEYEQLVLDEQMRIDKSARYEAFARSLVARRLGWAGIAAGSNAGLDLDRQFTVPASSKFEVEQTRFVHSNYANADRPWLIKLKQQLTGVAAEREIDKILSQLASPEFPLLEKINVFLFYQDWSAGREFGESAAAIEEAATVFAASGDSKRHSHIFKHFKHDMLAQLLRECRQRQRYLGLQAFIDMSSGIPRHLLMVLKYVHRWALFQGEHPFEGEPISTSAQQTGVLQASNWFFEDARAPGTNSEAIQAGIGRLALLFRRLRFSDKPVESSLITFSFDENEVSAEASLTIQQAHDTSLLLRIAGGAKDRNDERVHARYQLNPMLCPRFDLPLARRGTIALSSKEVEAVFGEGTAEFDKLVAVRLERMNAPFAKGASGARMALDDDLFSADQG